MGSFQGYLQIWTQFNGDRGQTSIFAIRRDVWPPGKKTTYMRVHIESSLGGAETVRGAGGGWGGGGEEKEEKKWRNHSFPSPWNLTCASG